MIYYRYDMTKAEYAEERRLLRYRRDVDIQNIKRETKAKIRAIEDALQAEIDREYTGPGGLVDPFGWARQERIAEARRRNGAIIDLRSDCRDRIKQIEEYYKIAFRVLKYSKP